MLQLVLRSVVSDMKRIGLAALLLVFLVVQAGAGEIEAEQFQREGKLREAFDAYLAAFRVSLGDSSKSAELRMKIIALALKLNPLPEIPEEARKHAAFAVAALDEKSDSGMKDATKEFLKATQLAPWWPRAYFNLAVLQEKQGDIKGAAENVSFYLAAAPGASDAAEVKNQLFKLQYKVEKLERSIAATASRTIPDLGIEMIQIKPGTFTAGDGSDSNNTPTQVTLTQAFLLGRTEVTQGQYEAVMGTNPSKFKKVGRNAPVEQVSWDDAMAFCRKLTERERAAGRLSEGYAYTLPTEAQWEYACRAATTGSYAGDLNAMAWYDENSGKKTHAVGTKQTNAWGLSDMHGNVWEWCLDWDASYPGGSVTDPGGAPSGSYHVFRGGGWNLSAHFCRSADRIDYHSPVFRLYYLGFRLALAPSR